MRSDMKDWKEGPFLTLQSAFIKLFGDPKSEGEGFGEKIASKVQNRVGQVEEVLEK